MKTAIIILGGWIARGEKGEWKTSDFYPSYLRFGINGHQIRVLAGFYLLQDDQEAILIASGSKGKLQDDPQAPTVASVIQKELLKLGIPKEKIVLDEQSDNTFAQLRAIPNFVAKLGIGKILIVSNEYHLPRIKAFLELPELQNVYKSFDYSLISADEIVSAHDEKMKKLIGEVYQSAEMRRHIAVEQQGIDDLKQGKYKFN